MKMMTQSLIQKPLVLISCTEMAIKLGKRVLQYCRKHSMCQSIIYVNVPKKEAESTVSVFK